MVGTARAENELDRLWGDIWGHARSRPKLRRRSGACDRPGRDRPGCAAGRAAPAAQALRPRPPRRRSPSCCRRSRPSATPSTSPATPLGQHGQAGRTRAGYLEQIYFQDGQLVKKGDPLFTVQQDQYKDQLQQAQAQLQAAKAARDYANPETVATPRCLEKMPRRRSRSTTGFSRERPPRRTSWRPGAVALARLNLEVHRSHSARSTARWGKHLVDPDNMVGGDGASPRWPRSCSSIRSTWSPASARRRRCKSGRIWTSAGFRSTTCTRSRSSRRWPARPAFRIAARLNMSRRQIDPATGTLHLRGILRNPDRTLLPGMFVNIRFRWARSPIVPCSFPRSRCRRTRAAGFFSLSGTAMSCRSAMSSSATMRSATCRSRPAASIARTGSSPAKSGG